MEVFRAFADAVAAGGSEFVVIDTAPTGHTLLLLDAAESCHREVSRTNRATMALVLAALTPPQATARPRQFRSRS